MAIVRRSRLEVRRSTGSGVSRVKVDCQVQGARSKVQVRVKIKVIVGVKGRVKVR